MTKTPLTDAELAYYRSLEQNVKELREERDRLAAALQPFANFACEPLNSCVDHDHRQPCFNCIARFALAQHAAAIARKEGE